MCPCQSWLRLQTTLAPPAERRSQGGAKGRKPCCCVIAIKSLWFTTASRTKCLYAASAASLGVWTMRRSCWRQKGKIRRYSYRLPPQLLFCLCNMNYDSSLTTSSLLPHKTDQILLTFSISFRFLYSCCWKERVRRWRNSLRKRRKEPPTWQKISTKLRLTSNWIYEKVAWKFSML